jgi:hypothetical protein
MNTNLAKVQKKLTKERTIHLVQEEVGLDILL